MRGMRHRWSSFAVLPDPGDLVWCTCMSSAAVRPSRGCDGVCLTMQALYHGRRMPSMCVWHVVRERTAAPGPLPPPKRDELSYALTS